MESIDFISDSEYAENLQVLEFLEKRSETSTTVNAISDSQYAEALQLLEVLGRRSSSSSMAEEEEEENILESVSLVSDSDYAEELQAREVLEKRFSTAEEQGTLERVSAISDSEYAEELQADEIFLAYLADLQISHEAEIPESSRKYCEICLEEKERTEMFNLENCSHLFCSDCVALHVQAKIEAGNPTVTCPDLNCDRSIEPPSCRGIIPENIFDRWEKLISEATILESEKFYCPFKDCSAMLVNDPGEEEEVITESECPVCRRWFCAKCQVPWHLGMDCEEFQELGVDERGGDDVMLHVLAKEKNWTRCPNCKMIASKTEGCIHMTCRCAFEFCYTCGLKWDLTHWNTCQG